jgi:hypothetical protein
MMVAEIFANDMFVLVTLRTVDQFISTEIRFF